MSEPTVAPIVTLFEQATAPGKLLLTVEEFRVYRQAGLSAQTQVGGVSLIERLLTQMVDEATRPGRGKLKQREEEHAAWLQAVLADLQADGPVRWTEGWTLKAALPSALLRPLLEAGCRAPGLFQSVVEARRFDQGLAQQLWDHGVRPTPRQVSQLLGGETPLWKDNAPAGPLKWVLDQGLSVIDWAHPTEGDAQVLQQLWPWHPADAPAPALLEALCPETGFTSSAAIKLFGWDRIQRAAVGVFIAAHVRPEAPDEDERLLVGLGLEEGAQQLWAKGWRPQLATSAHENHQAWALRSWVGLAFADEGETPEDPASPKQTYRAHLKAWVMAHVPRATVFDQLQTKGRPNKLAAFLAAEDGQSVDGKEPLVWAAAALEARQWEIEHDRNLRHAEWAAHMGPSAHTPAPREPSALAERIRAVWSAHPQVCNPAGQTLPQALQAQGFAQLAAWLDPSLAVAAAPHTVDQEREQFLALAGQIFDDLQAARAAAAPAHPGRSHAGGERSKAKASMEGFPLGRGGPFPARMVLERGMHALMRAMHVVSQGGPMHKWGVFPPAPICASEANLWASDPASAPAQPDAAPAPRRPKC